jgi:hypothetical protein
VKLRQQLKKLKQKSKQEKQFLLLDGALKKLVDLDIAIINNDKYIYSHAFEQTAINIISSPPGKLAQIKLANEVGRKLIPQIISMATTKTTRHDIENMLTAYVCLKNHIEEHNLTVDKTLFPDLTYAVWYLNDHNPTTQEVESWK